MEYCPLGDLQRYISSKASLPSTEAQELTHQILEGLHEMHENGFTHRDLKPAVGISSSYNTRIERLIRYFLIECPYQVAATRVLVGEAC
jgi:serine/threonine protein kinase